MENPALIIMAAGMGSRFGGLKQITPVGDNGEIIMDFFRHPCAGGGADPPRRARRHPHRSALFDG